MQTINVIGGSGFIGTRLVRRLRSKEQLAVQITDKAPSKAHPDVVTFGDVRSVEQLRTSIANGSVIVNLAAEHRDDVRPLSLYDEVNVAIGKGFDLVAALIGKRFAISSIRVKKFCANSVYNTAIDHTGFVPPVPLEQALAQTVRYEFVESHEHDGVFYTE